MASAREEILKDAFGSGTFKSTGAISEDKMDTLFICFVHYAGRNWNYVAQSGAITPAQLLDGSGPKGVDCGKLRGALKILIQEQWGEGSATNADINDNFITKPGLKCFDPKVSGNICLVGSMLFNMGCHFSTHYFINACGKYYDACLQAMYQTLEEPIRIKTKPVMLGLRVGGGPGTGSPCFVIRSVPKPVPGFGSYWEFIMFQDLAKKLTKEQLAAAKKNDVLKRAGLK